MNLKWGVRKPHPGPGEQRHESAAVRSPTARPPRIQTRTRGLFFSGLVAATVVVMFLIGPSVLPRSGPPASQLMPQMVHALHGIDGRRAVFKGELTISGTASVSQDTFSTTVPLSGRFVGPDVEVDATVGRGDEVDLIRTGSGFYLLRPGSGWMFYPTHLTARIITGHTQAGKGSGPVSGLLAGLAAATGQTFMGPTIDDVPTYEVRPLFLDSDPGAGTPAASILSGADVSIYIGRADALPRRLEFSLTLDAGDLGSAGAAFSSFANSVRIHLDVDFSQWGTAASIKAPHQVKDEGPAIKKVDGGFEEIPSLIGWPW